MSGAGTVVRLVGCPALLEWSLAAASRAAPGPVGREVVERGTAARHVLRWLHGRRALEVSREEIRCDALGRSVNAAGAANLPVDRSP
jgi:hypothetical protein